MRTSCVCRAITTGPLWVQVSELDELNAAGSQAMVLLERNVWRYRIRVRKEEFEGR